MNKDYDLDSSMDINIVGLADSIQTDKEEIRVLKKQLCEVEKRLKATIKALKASL